MRPDRRRVLKGLGTGTALLIGGVGTSAAGDEDETDDQGDGTTAEVRVGHLSPDTPDVDVYVGGDPDAQDPNDPTFSDLSYSKFRPGSGSYTSVGRGTYDVSVAVAGTDVDPIDTTLTLEANTDYTVLAVGENGPEGDEPDLRAVTLVDNDDETALPPADATLVRFVHASPDAGQVDVDVNGSTLLSGVSFGTGSDYYEAPSDATVEVVADADGDGSRDDSALGPLTNPFDDGEKGTVYVIGNAVPEDGDGPLPSGALEGNVGELGAVTTLDATSPAGGNGGDDEGDERRED